MRAEPRTLTRVFQPDIQYVVPIFQRRYVWNEADQWAGLWEDLVETVDEVGRAQELISNGADISPPSHFLGAVVVDRSLSVGAEVDERPLIDGQQRLTTMQVVLCAARDLAVEFDAGPAADPLSRLVENSAELVDQPHQRFKVWPSEPDRAGFEAAQTGQPSPADVPLISQARAFFENNIREWASADGGDPAVRITALSKVLRRNIELVVIDLEAHDNAQVIFESLNYGGRELEAIDLVKNHVFFEARHLGVDEQRDLHTAYWAPFDRDNWREKVTQGRLYRSRAELFLMHWLKLERLEEVPAHRLFVNFRSLPDLKDNIRATVERVAADRDLYERFDSDPGSLPAGAAGVLHRLGILDLGVPRPVILQLVRATPDQVSEARAARALHALDSYFWRRALLGRRTAAYNRTMLDVLKAIDDDIEHADDRVIEVLAGYAGNSVKWPTDQELLADLPTRQIYATFTKNARLAYLLRCIENAWRSRAEGPLGLGNALQVEHIIPQSWRENWPVAAEPAGTLPDREAERDAVVHRLGNLTLASPAMNAAMSNSAWDVKQGHLSQHSTVLITSRFREVPSWDEESVRARGGTMISAILDLWPGPTGQLTEPPPA